MNPVHLVFAFPGLLPPAGASQAGSPPAPALARLIAAAGSPLPEPDGIGAALAPIYGVARQADWPFASLRVAALGVDPGAGYWLAADPVTLVPGRDDVRLTVAVDDLAPEETAALLALLNLHFDADGLEFIAPEPNAWFVKAPATQQLTTRPIEVVVGRTLRTLLPAGADAGQWRRWHNEIQMLLHEHPVNIIRADDARPAVNSVWFWGGGTYPASTSPSIRTFANHGIATALAVHGGDLAQPIPAALDIALANCRAVTTVVIALDAPLDLALVEAAWAAPAWTALARGAIGTVTLIAGGDDGAAVWTAHRPGALERLATRLSPPGLAALLAGARAAGITDP